MSCKYNNCKHCGYKSECEIYKENAELKDKLNNLSSVAEVRLANWQKYEEENKELKKKIENLQKYLNTQNSYRECAETWEKLTYAKTIIQDLLDNTDEYARQRATDFLK